MKKALISLLIIISAFFIVAMGQPARSMTCSICASIFGYALFWKISLSLENKKQRFFISTIWFIVVQAVQLSWMTSIDYVGAGLLAAYAVLCILFGLQFGLLTILVNKKRLQKSNSLFAIAGCWVILEWSRLFILCGFTFNPSGLALAHSPLTTQIASIGGVFGLSFIVIATNLALLRVWLAPRKILNYCLLIALIALPYIFGIYHQKKATSERKELNILLVQPGLKLNQKMRFPGMEEHYLSPFIQWNRILAILGKHKNEKIDIILMPESTVPLPAQAKIYPSNVVSNSLKTFLFKETAPELKNFDEKYISNADYAQYISEFFQADVVIGMENISEKGAYASAFVFQPGQENPKIYNKRVLVPIGEYLPFQWLKKLAAKYGVESFFEHGQSPLIIKHPKVKYALSICYEDTFGELNRKNKLLGAGLLLNLTNDNWYPNSKLREQHYSLARLRTVENGIPIARACNTGISAVVDAYNNEIKALYEEYNGESSLVSVPLDQYNTFYSRYGDAGIILLSFSLLITFIRRK